MDSKENKSTPAATWRINGEPDPHGTHYDGERAALAMGHLTDDEMANAIFMNYDANPSPEEMLAGTGFRPIVWATAAKERIRWLSRALVKATATASGAAPQVVADERAPKLASVNFGSIKFELPKGKFESRDLTYAVERSSKVNLFGTWYTVQELESALQLAAAPVQAIHSDDIAVDRCAVAMKAKMAASRAKGRGGWDDPAQCSIASLSALLRAHVDKGDPLDVANIAMMIQQRGGSISAPVQAQEPIGYAPTYLTERIAAGDSAVMLTVTRKPLPGHGVTVALYTAPVQPVAVPDGELREVVGKVIRAMESSAAPIDLAHALGEVSRQGGRIDFDADLMAELLAAYSAAPAAQGDALNVAQIEDGYEGGTCIADPTRLGGTVHLHYISPEHAESAFEVIAEIIDAAIAAKAAS